MRIVARVIDDKVRVPKVQADATDGIAEILGVSHVALKRYRFTARSHYLSDNPLGAGFIRCIVDYNRCTSSPKQRAMAAPTPSEAATTIATLP